MYKEIRVTVKQYSKPDIPVMVKVSFFSGKAISQVGAVSSQSSKSHAIK